MAEAVNEKEQEENRGRIIVRTSLIGIGANLFLAAFKAAVGILSNSIAVVLDAVNNLSDAASSVITIVGTKLAGRAPDREHPFGHGRTEYLTSMVISVIILYAGVTSFLESLKKILHPSAPTYTPVGLLIIAVAVLVKIILGRYVKRTGERVHSDSLVNSGADATLDAVISASTLIAALIYLIAGVSLEAFLGAVISLVIIRSGIEMLRDTISQILGERADAHLSVTIKKDIASVPGVLGAYDLVLHNYGPDTYNGSVHIEVEDTLNAKEIARIQNKVASQVYQNEGVILTGVSIYTRDTVDRTAVSMREEIRQIVESTDHALQMHGFSVDEEEKTMRFDVVVDWEIRDREAFARAIRDKVLAAYPGYSIRVNIDSSITD